MYPPSDQSSTDRCKLRIDFRLLPVENPQSSPVSYTHLDVYKRQLLEGLPVPIVGRQVRPQVGAAGDDLLPQGGSADVATCPGGSRHSGVQLLATCCPIGHADVANTLARQGQRLGIRVTDDGIVVQVGDCLLYTSTEGDSWSIKK